MARELIISVEADTSKAHLAFQTLDADIEKTVQSAEKVDAAVDKMATAFTQASVGADAYRKALLQIAGESGIASQSAAAATHAQRMGQLSAAVKAATGDLSTLQKQWVDFANVPQARGAIEQQLGNAMLTATALTNELKKTKQQLDDTLNPATGKGFVDSLKDIGPALTTIGRQMSTFLTVPIAGAAAASVKFASDFERDMVKVSTLSGIAERDMQSMRTAILQLAPAVGIGPDALAKALLAVTSTGLKGQQAMDVLTVAAKASAVGLGETATIARTITSIIQAYGEKNITAAHAAEIMFKTVKDGNAEAGELAGSLGRVVGIAAQVGVSFDQVGTYIATFTRLGVSSAEAVTSLRSVLSELIKPSKGAQDALASVGMTFTQLRQEVSEKGLTAALINLVDKFKGNEEGLSKLIPNIRALAGVLGTAGAQATQMAGIQQHLASTTDELGAAFQRTGETAAFKWEAVKAQFEASAITLGNELLPQLKLLIDNFLVPGVQHLTDWIKWWSELPGPVKTFTEVMLGLVAVGGPVMLGLGALSRAILAIRALLFASAAVEGGSLVGWLTKLGLGGAAGGAATGVGLGLSKLAMSVPIGAGGVTDDEEIARWLQSGAKAPGSPAMFKGGLHSGDIMLLNDNTNIGQVPGDVTSGIAAESVALTTLADKVKALTSAQREDILSKDAQKESTKAIAKETGIASDVVSTFLKQQHAGAAAVKAMTTALQKQEAAAFKATLANIAESHSDGLAAQSAIAKSFGGQTVLRDLGVQMGNIQLGGARQTAANVGALMPDLSGQANRHMTEIMQADRATQAWQQTLHNLSQEFAQLAQISGGAFGGILQDAGKIIGEMSLMTQATAEFKHAQGDAATGTKADYGQMATSAIAMGASAVGTFQSIRNGTTSSAMGIASLTMKGAMIGSVVPVIGTAVGAAIGLFAGVVAHFTKGVSAAEKAGRELEAQYEKSFGGFQGMMDQVGGVYAATGRSAQQAQADVKALIDAEKLGADAVKAAIAKINEAFNEQKQDAADLDAAIRKYGFSIEELGPKMQKQQLDQQALGLLNDWRLLVNAGIAVGTVNDKMAASMNDYLAIARKTGAEVPAAMKPILQSMIDQGKLVDADGNKIDDLAGAGVTFADTMTAGFDRVVAKLQTLLEGLGLVPKKIADIASAAQTIPAAFTPQIEDQREFAATGGLVTDHGIQHFATGGHVLRFNPRGTDTVPAMLTPGEMVLTKRQQEAAGLGGERMAGHHGGGTMTINHAWTISAIDSRDLRDRVEKDILPMICEEVEDYRRGSGLRLGRALKRAS